MSYRTQPLVNSEAGRPFADLPTAAQEISDVPRTIVHQVSPGAHRGGRVGSVFAYKVVPAAAGSPSRRAWTYPVGTPHAIGCSSPPRRIPPSENGLTPTRIAPCCIPSRSAVSARCAELDRSGRQHPAADGEDPAGLGNVHTGEERLRRRPPTGMDHPIATTAMNLYGLRAGTSSLQGLAISRFPFFPLARFSS